jgi:hypothetical protein
MEQIYTVDETRLSSIQKRAFIRGLKILGIMLLVMFIMMYPQRRYYFKSYTWISYFITIPILMFAMYIGARRLTENYRTLEIILDKQGVRSKAQMSPYKNIPWDRMIVKVKDNGIINLYDSSVPALIRKWNGRGWIIIPPEMQDREALLSEIQKHSAGI